MQMGYRQVWAVFQPFTYSRTSILLDDFARVLSMPDRAVITEIMGAREINTYGIKATDLSSKIPGSVRSTPLNRWPTTCSKCPARRPGTDPRLRRRV